MATYELREEGVTYDRIEAESLSEALDEAEDRFDASAYDASDGTIWIRIWAAEDRDDCASRTIRVDPEEPECSGRAHDWQSPHAILGGLEENPGVWGHGGGVIIREVCMHCGCARVTDTWAQNRETGEQGLESVAYEPGKYADEIEAMREAEKDAEDAEDAEDDEAPEMSEDA